MIREKMQSTTGVAVASSTLAIKSRKLGEVVVVEVDGLFDDNSALKVVEVASHVLRRARQTQFIQRIARSERVKHELPYAAHHRIDRRMVLSVTGVLNGLSRFASSAFRALSRSFRPACSCSGEIARKRSRRASSPASP
jgi:hypothetical protein